MKERQLDVLFIEPNSSASYQGLADKYAAIETPTWSLLLAQSCRAKGFGVGILDANAKRLHPEQVAIQVWQCRPKLAVFVVYGQNPNSGTTNMSGALLAAQYVKRHNPDVRIAFVGSHSSAKPMEVIEYPSVDYVFTNEGVYALHNLLEFLNSNQKEPHNVNGIVWKTWGEQELGYVPIMNAPERVVPTELMDRDLPGYAWDLLPYKSKPFDMYRSHFWHADYDHAKTTPFAALYTSLGCQFKCNFCMINILNRNSNRPDAVASDFNVMRFWSPEFIIKEFDKLAEYGVETVRLVDEMFFLNKKYYDPLVDLLIERNHGFNMWAYSRIDTCREDKLARFKAAGINWLALGIESANQVIRQEITKGRFQDVNIREVVKSIQDAGIYVVGNYIFGFPNEKFSHLKETLDLAMELNTEFANFYCAAALPGSPLHLEAEQNGWELPETFEGYSFFSEECKPLPTHHLSAANVLQFRDMAWQQYYTNPEFLKSVEEKFGKQNRENIEAQTKIKLKRNLLEKEA